METNLQEEDDILSKLKKYPELQSSFKALLDVAEASSGTPDLANDIEELIIEKTREVAKNTLSQWA